MTTPADRHGRWGPFDPVVPAVALVSFVTYALHGINGALSRDLSVYVYAGQRLVDAGVPPYVGILNRSGPFAHLLPGVGVAVARLFDGDDLAGARWFYLVLSVLCVCVVYLFARDLFASPLVGLTAAAAFLSFAGFIEYASDGPREKTPMVLFMLLAMWAANRGRWFWAGLCLSVATLTLQIGFFVAAPFVLLTLLLAPQRGGRLTALLRVALGGLVPVAVLAAYFASVGALDDAVDGFLVINLHYTVANPMTDNLALRWLLLQRGFGVSLWFLLAGLAALLLLAPAALVPRWRRADPSVLPVAVLGVASLGGLYWTVRDFDSWPDAFPLLPLAALGIGLLVARLLRWVPGVVARTVAVAWVVLAVVAALTWSVTERHDELTAQRAAVTAVLGQLPGGARLLAVNAPQPLVLSGSTNPTRHQMFTSGLDEYVDDTWPGGLHGYADDIVHRWRPDLVVVGQPRRAWLRHGIRDDYTLVGSAPGWQWWARSSLGTGTLDRLRRAAERTGHGAP
jgi:hypothetical protein